MSDDAVNMGLMLFQRGVLGGTPGGATSEGRPLYILPPLNFRPIFDLQNSALLAWVWQPVAAVQFNASNPNGLLAKIIRALQLDQFVKNINFEGSKRHLHEAEAENAQYAASYRPASTPGSAGGHGYSRES